MHATRAPSPEWGETIGWVDEPRSEGILSGRVRVAGWALSTRGIRAVELRFEHQRFLARYGLPRHDVAAVRPGYPDNPLGGFEFVGDLTARPAPAGIERRTLTVVAIASDGSERILGRRSLVEASAHARWRFIGERSAPPFFVIPALSGVAAGSAFGLDTWYSAYVSRTTRIGMRVPVLYLRTTTGRSDDYRFDAAFDVRRRVGDRPVADDALDDVLSHARQVQLPVLVTLNGGIWADAAGTAPEWDVNDRLEEDPRNCQWNARDEVMPDDYLRHLPGSHAAPELARALTLNVYATDVRRYKRRNLQQAAQPIVRFMAEHPDLFIGVNLDPDVYINPFFSEAQWYDYNPDTLRQFRHWLAGTGPYGGAAEAGLPDLSGHRRTPALSLRDAADLARRAFAAWDDVDPPRTFSRDPARPFWKDAWVHEWETFRRHLVSLHYDELAQWLVEAGLPRDRIWSSQGLMAPAAGCMPLALKITSPVKNYDSGGVSIAGSKPRDGHLGAIVYGDAATNDIAMENGGTLFDTLAVIDPGFAIVEFNTADLRHPERHPTYAAAYRALRDLWNAGARFVSPMAWNGTNGNHASSPDYVSYTAWRNTPLEDAARDFLLARSGLPLGAKLWTFGTQEHADDDGWRSLSGTSRTTPGALELRADATGRLALLSPRALALSRSRIERFVLGLAPDATPREIRIAARGDGDWESIACCGGDDMETTEAGRLVQCAPAGTRDRIDRLRIDFTVAPNAVVLLTRVAILPPA